MFSNNWSQRDNWDVATPRNDGTASLTFAGTARTQPNTDTGWSISTLSFASGASAFTLGGSALTVAGNITNSSANTQTINNALALSSTTFQGVGPIVVNGAVGNASGTTGVLGTVTFTAGLGGGAGSAVRVDGGSATFAGATANTFGGTVMVNNGTLALGKTGGALAIPGPLLIGDGAGAANTAIAFFLSNQQTSALNDITIRQDGALIINNQHNVATRNLTMTGGELFLEGGTIQLNGTLTVNGSAIPAYVISAGKPFGFNLMGGARTFNIGSGVTSGYDFDLTDIGLANGTLVKTGPGSMRLDNDVISSTVALTLLQGTLSVSNSGLVQPRLLTLGGGTIRGDVIYYPALTTGNVLVTGDTAINQDIYDATAAFNFGGTVSAVGAHALTLSLIQSSTFSGGIDATGAGNSLTLQGNAAMGLGATVNFTGGTIAGTLVLTYGTYAIQGAAVTASVTVGSTGVLQVPGGAIVAGPITNAGTVQVTGGGADFAGGLINQSTLALPVNVTVTIEGSGLDNQGTLTLVNTTLLGTPMSNSNTIQGHGTLGGGGGFTNVGYVVASQGPLILANAGGTTNLGNLATSVGSALQIGAGTFLRNAGTLTLGGAGVQGPGGLTNAAGGTIAGAGAITSPFVNAAGGTVVVTAGSLSVTPAFANAGAIALQGLTASLSGGNITNTGTIQGFGSMGSAVANTSGLIEASGGTLGIYGGVTQGSGATMTVDAGARLLVSPGLAVNSGLISLLGGTLDNAGTALNNTGTVAGFGVLRTGGLTNNGTITLTGGNSSVDGPVTNAAGHALRVMYNPAIFTGAFQNNGTLLVTSTTATFVAGGAGSAVPALAGAGGLTVSPGAVVSANGIAQGSVAIQGVGGSAASAGTLQVLMRALSGSSTPSRSVSVIGTLTIASAGADCLGTLDLTNNDLVLTDTAEATVRGYVASWYAGGGRTGRGLAASLAGTGSGPDALATLGVITNSNGVGGALYATFDGVTVGASAVLVKYTYAGDTNLDGSVDGADLSNLLTGLHGGSAGWVNGDVNYDGVVNGSDLAVLLASLRGQGVPFGDLAGSSGAVPDAGGAAPAGWAGLVALGRRGRRSVKST